jgi:hypothetical protein
MWRKYFKVINIVPGPVIISGHGTVDFSKDNLSIDLLKSLYEKKSRFIEITPLGKEKLYGIIIPEKAKDNKSAK